MDAAQVTNHQYVEFLNQNLSQLRVERKIIRNDDEIWLLLGEITEGYDPITFRNGRFKLNNATYASYPVLRVTAFGASAYANFYGRRLPTVEEWFFAANKGAAEKSNSPDTHGSPTGMQMERWMGSEMMSNWMMGDGSMEQENSVGIPPQTLRLKQNRGAALPSTTNAFGVKGMNGDIGEWAILTGGATSRDEKESKEYVIMSGIVGLFEKNDSMLSIVIRHPWEAFEEVGFRSARSVKIQSTEHE
jgi:serine/threonine-protein kinase